MSNLWKPPGLLVGHPTLFSREMLESYEREILANPRADEHDASRFFQRFPQFLCLGQGAEIRREIVLVDAQGRPLGRVDFFRRNYGRAFWDVIELKTPKAPLVTKAQGLHPTLSGIANDAISQVQDYAEHLRNDQVAKEILARKGILVCNPSMFVVVGREVDDVSPETMETLFARVRHLGVGLYSYTGIYRFATEHYRQNRVFILPIQSETIEKRDEVEDAAVSGEKALPNRPNIEAHRLFLWKYVRRVDAQGRIQIPLEWRHKDSDKSLNALLLGSGTTSHILVFGEPVFDTLLKRFDSSPFGDIKSTMLRHIICESLARASLDAAGRLPCPHLMLREAGVNREATLIGMGDRFEIWAPARYEQALMAEKVRAEEAFRML